MAAEGLQRSASSYRRTGSSGLIWEDRFLSRDLSHLQKQQGGNGYRDMRVCHSVGSIGMMKRNNDGRMQQDFQTIKVFDPPSPKGCGLWSLFGKKSKKSKNGRKH